MKLLGVFATLVCFFANAADSDSSCDDNLTTVCVPIGEDVLVPCPNVTSTIMKFKLLWNGEIIFMEKFPHEGPAPLLGGQVNVQLMNGNGTFNLRLGNVNGSSHGIYRCNVEVILPPPKFTQRGSHGILLLVEGHQCKVTKGVGGGGGAEKEADETHCLLIWIPIVSVVSLYSLIVTVTLVVCCMRFRTLASDNEYMNTKPPTPRAHWWKA